MSTADGVEDLLRTLAPQVLGALVRRYGHFDACEDAVQEALLAATVQWPEDGMPTSPRGWLFTVAARRLTDELRGVEARRRREDRTAALDRRAVRGGRPERPATPGATAPAPALPVLPSCAVAGLQLALTLRAVGGLTTSEIARAFLVPERPWRNASAGQRHTRVRRAVRAASHARTRRRLRVVLHVLYLMFNEGYTATSGPDLGAPS